MKVTSSEVRIRHGGGILLIWGVPFLAAGCAILASACVGKTGGPAIVAIPMGLLFAAIGGLLTFGRAGVDIDIQERTCRRWYGLLVPMWSTWDSIDRFDHVAAVREERKDDDGVTLVYALRLTGPNGGAIDIDEYRSIEPALDDAEALAAVLGLPLIDNTGRETVERDADHLTESIRDRRRRTGTYGEGIPEPPPGMKTQFTIRAREMVLRVPPRGLEWKSFLILIPALGFAALFVFLFFLPTLEIVKKAPLLARLIFAVIPFVLFAVLPVGGAVFSLLRQARTRYEIHVSRDLLRVTKQGVLFSRTQEIRAHELEEINMMHLRDTPHQTPFQEEHIIARSAHRTIRFAGHLPLEEREWIRRAIEELMSA